MIRKLLLNRNADHDFHGKQSFNLKTEPLQPSWAEVIKS